MVASLNPTSDDYFTKLFGFSPRECFQNPYVLSNFKTFQSQSFALSGEIPVVTLDVAKDVDYTKEATFWKSTPFITSQKVGGNTTNLFKFHTLSHGTQPTMSLKSVFKISNQRNCCLVLSMVHLL